MSFVTSMECRGRPIEAQTQSRRMRRYALGRAPGASHFCLVFLGRPCGAGLRGHTGRVDARPRIEEWRFWLGRNPRYLPDVVRLAKEARSIKQRKTVTRSTRDVLQTTCCCRSGMRSGHICHERLLPAEKEALEEETGSVTETIPWSTRGRSSSA